MQEQNLLTGLEKFNKFLDRMPYLGIPKMSSEKGDFAKHAWVFKPYPKANTLTQPGRFGTKREYVAWIKESMTERFITSTSADFMVLDMRDFTCIEVETGVFHFISEGFDLNELPAFSAYKVTNGDVEELRLVIENEPMDCRLLYIEHDINLDIKLIAPVAAWDILPDIPNSTNKKYKIIFLQDGYLTNFTYSPKESNMETQNTQNTPSIAPNIRVLKGDPEVKLKSPTVELKAYASLFSISKLKNNLGEKIAHMFPSFNIGWSGEFMLYFVAGYNNPEDSINTLDGVFANLPASAIKHMDIEFIDIGADLKWNARFYECLFELILLENTLLILRETGLFSKNKSLDINIVDSKAPEGFSFNFIDDMVAKIKKIDDAMLEGKITKEKAISIIEKMVLANEFEAKTYIRKAHADLLLTEVGVRV